MIFELSTRLSYEAVLPSTLILNIQAANNGGQIINEAFGTDPGLNTRELFSDCGEKRLQIVDIPDRGNISIYYNATVENRILTIPGQQLVDVPINQMPESTLTYLNPSRYCQSDRLYKFAFNRFGSLETAFQKVMAICAWINQNVEYNGWLTTAQTSALDTITEQVGVCRDFAHLGIALCRALTIPARYLSCYAYKLQPPDFHACFEAYLGGYWVVFDPTRLVPINGLIRISTGRDAADSAFASTFGCLEFKSLEVNIDLQSNELQWVDYNSFSDGYCYV